MSIKNEPIGPKNSLIQLKAPFDFAAAFFKTPVSFTLSLLVYFSSDSSASLSFSNLSCRLSKRIFFFSNLSFNTETVAMSAIVLETLSTVTPNLLIASVDLPAAVATELSFDNPGFTNLYSVILATCCLLLLHAFFFFF